jgi:predicted  nucleic acid-binding Zn-ribbon protein
MHEVTINNLTKEELEINWQDFNEEQKGFAINRLFKIISDIEGEDETAALEAQIEGLEDSISDLEEEVSDLEDEVEKLELKIEELQGG